MLSELKTLELFVPFHERILIGRNPGGIWKKMGKEQIKQKSKVFTVNISINMDNPIILFSSELKTLTL